MSNNQWYILFYLFLCHSCKSKLEGIESNVVVNVNGSELIAYGRSDIDSLKRLEIITSACHTGISFIGDSLIIYATSGDTSNHGFLQFELDGKYIGRRIVSGIKPNKITIMAREQEKQAQHRLWIYKATEAITGPIFITSIEGINAKIINKPKLKSIEFIGNSITCGAAADSSEYKCGVGPYQNQHNAYMAYGPRVARMLGVDFILNSISGAGIYRNWNSDGPTVPQMYDDYDLCEGGDKKYDFTKKHPDVISIALGTNDLSHGDGRTPRKPFDKKIFVEKYVEFVKHIKSLHPMSIIGLTDSPMGAGQDKLLLNECIIQVKKTIDLQYPNDAPITLFRYKHSRNSGCTGHPSVEEHGLMADEILPFYQSMLLKSK